METLAEFLKKEENQDVVLEKVIDGLRQRGEWGKHGLYANIGKSVGTSAAYIGRIFSGKNPVRENFAHDMAGYLGVRVKWLLGEIEWSFREEVEYYKEVKQIFKELEQEEDDKEEVFNKKLNIACNGAKKFRMLVNVFYGLPVEDMDEAINTLLAVKDVKIRILHDRLPDDTREENFPDWLDED